jgi:hypothetical protein
VVWSLVAQIDFLYKMAFWVRLFSLWSKIMHSLLLAVASKYLKRNIIREERKELRVQKSYVWFTRFYHCRA